FYRSGLRSATLPCPTRRSSDLAPNFSKWRQYDEIHQKETISDNGLILGFPMMNDVPEGANLGLCVRQDYLDQLGMDAPHTLDEVDRKSTRLNSSHVSISYAVFC